MKKCSTCQKEKVESDFYFFNGTQCKECIRKTARANYTKNKDKIQERKRKYRLKNRDKLLRRRRDVYSVKYKEQNKEYRKKYYAKNREKRLEYNKKYRLENKGYFRKIAENNRKDPKFRLNDAFSSGIYKSLKDGNGKNGRHWESFAEYNADDLRKHLESKFMEGMSWKNYGEWHIDHIIPISVFNFKNPEDIDFKRCWALKNLQPLWAKANMIKHNKLNKPFQPCLTLKVI